MLTLQRVQAIHLMSCGDRYRHSLQASTRGTHAYTCIGLIDYAFISHKTHLRTH